MRRYFITCVLAVAACSETPAGQSDYYDEAPLATAVVQQSLQSQQTVIRQIRADANARRSAPVITTVQPPVTDDVLVANLDRAIRNAPQQGQPLDLTPQAASQTSNAPTQQSPIQQPQTQAPPVQQVQQHPVQQQQVAHNPAPSNQGVGTDGNPQISDNTFATVTANQSIEGDAQRLEQLSQQTVVLQAPPVPQSNPNVNLAAFARSTTHNIGERVYQRASRSNSSARRECRRYGNPDAAQRAFLAAGGPETDDKKMDPDGDGFVCGWSPIPYRSLRVGSG